ncbi:MAG: VWA domain-containing protein [Planctomycetota bacterium]
MQFLAPQLLWWIAGLGALALALYLFRRRPKQVRVSTLPFFKSLAKVYQESAWLRRLKKLVSFLLTAIVILAASAALARLVIAPKSDELHSVIVLLDTSASMGAKDAEGKTRLERAQEWVQERLPGLPPGVAVMVMRYDRRPEILLPHSYDRRAAAKALAAVTVRPLAGDARAALELAKRLAALEAPSTIWHLTDRPAEDPAAGVAPLESGSAAPSAAASPGPAAGMGPGTGPGSGVAPLISGGRVPEGEVTVQTIDLGLPTPRNVGVTALSLRPQPLEHGKAEAFIEVQGAPVGAAPYEVQLELLREGELVLLQQLSVAPGGTERLLVPVDANQGPTVTIRLKADGDVLPADDTVHARLPEARPVRVAWITPPKQSDPFTQLALSALQEEGELEVFQVDPARWPLVPSDGRPFDVAIFDQWLPEAWDEALQAIVIDPPRALGPIHAARLERPLPLDALRAVSEGHPLLYGVASQRVSLHQTVVLEATGALTPLWVGPAGPVMSAGEVKGQRLVVLGFSALRSERLGYMASYPLLLGNAILWLTQPSIEARTGNNFQTGHLLEAEGRELTWCVPGAAPETVARQGALTELDRIGLFECGPVQGSAALLSSAETRLVENPAPATRQEQGALPLLDRVRGDLRPLLLWLAVGALLLEAWLFHRAGVF